MAIDLNCDAAGCRNSVMDGEIFCPDCVKERIELAADKAEKKGYDLGHKDGYEEGYSVATEESKAAHGEG